MIKNFFILINLEIQKIKKNVYKYKSLKTNRILFFFLFLSFFLKFYSFFSFQWQKKLKGIYNLEIRVMSKLQNKYPDFVLFYCKILNQIHLPINNSNNYAYGFWNPQGGLIATSFRKWVIPLGKRGCTASLSGTTDNGKQSRFNRFA